MALADYLRDTRTVVISGYFNPLHTGHLRYIRASKRLGTDLIVIVNNDLQVRLKKGTPFMCEKDRMEIIKAVKWVDRAVLSVDKDRSVCETLRKISKKTRIDIFANGGDRDADNVPERDTCVELGIGMRFNVGGGKIRRSSELLSDFYKQHRQKKGNEQ